MSPRPMHLRTAIIALVAILAVPWTGALAGETREGEVTFRLTLEGPVEPDDGFFIDVRCDGGEFCRGLDEQRTVYFCAHPVIVDTTVCEAKSFEFTVAIPPQRIEYHLNRVPNVDAPQHQATIVLSGSWQVHGGHQVISLGYVYPDGTSAPPPALPDTAMSAP